MILNDTNTWRKVFGLSATFLIALFLSTSCKKKDTNLGTNVLDPNDLLNSAQVDTFSLKTFTIEEDSVITDNPAYAVLGSYNDPKFGTFNASFYSQFRLQSINPDFTSQGAIVVDSLMLGLEYVGYHGDFTPQTLEVFEMTESIHIDSTYYAFSTKTVSATNLIEPGYETFTPDPDGTTVIDGDTVDTQLRIRLKNSLADQLIAEASTGTAFSSNESFLSYFKGLNVRVNNGAQPSGKGGVFYFNLNDPLSKMTIYYTQGGIQKSYDFLINTECADFNHVVINNAGKPVQTVINDTVSGQKEFYAQAFKNRAVVDMAGLANLSKKAIIHKAELYLPIQYQSFSKYIPSDELSVSARIDGTLSGIGVYALYDTYNKRYVVDLRNYVQALVAGNISTTELIFSPRQFITSADRIIFNGPTSINKMKPQLIVTYTEF